MNTKGVRALCVAMAIVAGVASMGSVAEEIRVGDKLKALGNKLRGKPADEAPTDPGAAGSPPAAAVTKPADAGPDVIGLWLGMPAEAVPAVLKAHEARYELSARLMPLQKNGAEVRKYTYGILAIVPGAIPGASTDQTMVSFASHKGSSRVLMINRDVGFPRGSEPLVSATIDSLHVKYGKETDSRQLDAQRVRLMWSFTADGKPVAASPRISYNQCVQAGEGGGYGFGVVQFEANSNQLYNRMRNAQAGLYDWLRQNAACGTVLSVEIVGAQGNLQLVSNLRVRLENHADYVAAIDWQRADVESADRGQQLQEVDRARQNAAPKL